MIKTNRLEFSHDGKITHFFPDFLHLICGLLRPQKGEIIIENQSLTQLSAAALDRFRGQKIGIIFQENHFVRALSVTENLSLAQNLAGQKTDRNHIFSLLKTLQIYEKRDRRPHQLSLGEQQRVAIARALVNRPALILADEPTSALDDENANEVMQLIENQSVMYDSTLLVVTHDNRLKSRFEKKILLENLTKKSSEA
jgi:ABC-type lipoprotein export system ATPase subunit